MAMETGCLGAGAGVGEEWLMGRDSAFTWPWVEGDNKVVVPDCEAGDNKAKLEVAGGLGAGMPLSLEGNGTTDGAMVEDEGVEV